MDIDDLPKNAANYTALTPLWFLERAATVHPTRKSLIHGSRRYPHQQTYHHGGDGGSVQVTEACRWR
ncbi:fatty-acyl-CoA synthase [Vigna unguiculata]|uniref:Fatty-acyl-CoA synthase n=1 Tax=Vigna unguiculata TaxID=3917 RepID=A0A4D6KYA8_VIGUN|nr:fatty-acyl-CoA synthase [Vigna unguiculata]